MFVTDQDIISASLDLECNCFDCLNIYLDIVEFVFPDREFNYDIGFSKKVEDLFQKYPGKRVLKVTSKDIDHACNITDMLYQALVMYYISTDDELY